MTNTDLLDQLAGIAPDSAAAEVRSRRTDVARHTQGSYDVLLTPEDTAGVTPLERALIALRVAIVTPSPALKAHYQQLAESHGVSAAQLAAVANFPAAGELTPRQNALLRHTDLLINEPSAASPADIAALKAQNFTARDIVIIAQLIAFLSYQVRVLAGLRLLGKAS